MVTTDDSIGPDEATGVDALRRAAWDARYELEDLRLEIRRGDEAYAALAATNAALQREIESLRASAEAGEAAVELLHEIEATRTMRWTHRPRQVWGTLLRVRGR